MSVRRHGPQWATFVGVPAAPARIGITPEAEVDAEGRVVGTQAVGAEGGYTIRAQPQLELVDEDMRVDDRTAADMNDGHDLGLSVDDGPNPDSFEATPESGHELVELEMSAVQVAEEEVMEPLRM
jgi:hypothetical protein